MSKKEYKFNPQTLTYEPVERPARLKRYFLARRCILFFLAAMVTNLFYSLSYYTPKLRSLEVEGGKLASQFGVFDSRLGSTEEKLGELAHRDNYVYRSLFGADTLSLAGIYTPYAPSTYASYNSDYNGITRNAWQRLDAVTRLVYRQSVSLDELQVLSKNKEKMAASIPAIWPINKKDLKGPIGALVAVCTPSTSATFPTRASTSEVARVTPSMLRVMVRLSTPRRVRSARATVSNSL